MVLPHPNLVVLNAAAETYVRLQLHFFLSVFVCGLFVNRLVTCCNKSKLYIGQFGLGIVQ